MKKIALTKNKFAIVDDSDYDFLNKWKWHINSTRGKYYAVRNIKLKNGKRSLVKMHRLIMDTSIGMEVDHIDGDGLNNQRKNLRNCTKFENAKNRLIGKNNKSGFKGVSWNKQKKKWHAYISCNKKLMSLGFFSTKEDAYKSYCDACTKYHREFSKLK